MHWPDIEFIFKLSQFYLHTQAQMPHVRNVIATEIEEGKIYDREMLQSLQNTANESTYNSPNHMSEGSPPKNSSGLRHAGICISR